MRKLLVASFALTLFAIGAHAQAPSSSQPAYDLILQNGRIAESA